MNPLLSPTFVIGYIRVDSIEGASALNIGNNWPTNFQSYKKHNQGFGTVKGNHNEIQGARTLLNDPDLLDVFGSPEQIPEWLREMLLSIEQNQTDSLQESTEESPSSDRGPAGGVEYE